MKRSKEKSTANGSSRTKQQQLRMTPELDARVRHYMGVLREKNGGIGVNYSETVRSLLSQRLDELGIP